MPPVHIVLIVGAGVVAGIALFGLVVGLGTLAVRWLKLPTDPVEAAIYEPPMPATVKAGDPAAARERAAAWQARAALGRRAYAGMQRLREIGELAEWVAWHRAESATAARAAEQAAVAGVEQARKALETADEAGVAAGEQAIARAAADLDALAVGLPDMHAADRKRLIRLTVALVGALVLAVLASWLR